MNAVVSPPTPPRRPPHAGAIPSMPGDRRRTLAVGVIGSGRVGGAAGIFADLLRIAESLAAQP